jgi:hypothetical protein
MNKHNLMRVIASTIALLTMMSMFSNYWVGVGVAMLIYMLFDVLIVIVIDLEYIIRKLDDIGTK